MDADNLPIIGPNWNAYSYFYGEGLLARIHFDTDAAEEDRHVGYSECIRLILSIPPDHVQDDGQPASGELKTMLAHQRELVHRLASESVRCRMVGTMLYGGMFDWIFQVEPEDGPHFRLIVTKWADTVAPHQIEMKELAGWAFYDAKVRPAPEHAQQIEDRRVIQELIDAGSNPEAPHQLDHTILGPHSVLVQIARDLERNGFVRATFPAEAVLQISTKSPLHLFEIWGTTRRLLGYCASCGARYDGWGASIVRDKG